MPREDRRIYFSYDETYKAIYALAMQKGLKKPPPGEIVKIEKSEGDDKQLVITLQNPQENWDEPKKMEYSRDFIAAAFMLMCRGAGIPLPKSAKKSVVLSSNEIILRAEI